VYNTLQSANQLTQYALNVQRLDIITKCGNAYYHESDKNIIWLFLIIQYVYGIFVNMFNKLISLNIYMQGGAYTLWTRQF